MIIKSLELADFRNYDSLHIDLSSGTNILYGNIEILQDTPVGSLLVVLSGHAEQVKSAISTLADHHVKVEVLKGGSTL